MQKDNYIQLKKYTNQINKLGYFIVCLFIFLLSNQIGFTQTTTESFTTAGAATWTCPAGVTSITIECWGAGGGGGGVAIPGSTNHTRGGGGAGGGYVKRTSYLVVPGTIYSLNVGAGGTAGSTSGGDGGPGEDSWFVSSATIVAVGGNGGKGATASNGTHNGAGGTKKISGNIGADAGFSFYGGAGSSASGAYNNASRIGNSGAGGASAGTGNDGGDATGVNAGTSVTGGVAGVAGRTSEGNGSTGNSGGGGASGAFRYNTTVNNASGGVGGAGKINITYSTPSYTTVTLSTAGAFTWTVPCGVTSIQVEAWGGGGGGGNSNNVASNGGSGGGGGAYSKSSFGVTPTATCYYTVGAGGAGGPANSTTAAGSGGDSWFNLTANSAPTTTAGLLAKGGGAGLNNNATTGGTGGQASAGFANVVKYNGGNGGPGGLSGGGGGGSSAGTGTNGNNGNQGGLTGDGAGGAAPTGGFAGGSGSTTASGSPGSSPGGGGAGSDDAVATKGGDGGVGQIIISYVATTTPAAAVISSPANNATNVAATGTTLNWTNGGGAVTYNVYFGTDNPPTNIVNGTNQAGTSYDLGTLSNNQIYYWRIDAVNCGSTTQGSVWSFTTQDACTIPISGNTSGSATSICSGTTTTLTGGTVSGGTGTYTYLWESSTNNNTWSNAAGTNNAANYTTASLTTSTYFRRIVTSGGCTNTASSIMVTVNANPTVSSTVTETSGTANDGTVCNGTSVTLSGSGASSYTWSGGITNNTAFTASSTTTYTVTGTDANGCTNTATRVITVNALPTVNSTVTETSGTANDGTVCNGTSVTLSGSGASSYTWSGGITNNTAFTASSTTTYTVTGTDANGCTNTATRVITVNALPTVSSTVTETSGTANDGTVCNGTSVTLSGSGASSYTWSGGITNNTAFTASSTTTYTVTGTDANGCTNTATRVITVNALPIANAGVDQGPVCASTTTLTANTLNSGETGTWSCIGGSGDILSPNSATSTVNNLGLGNNTFRWTVTNGNCSANDDIVVIISTATIYTPQAGNASAITSWANPPCSFDDMMVVARASTSATGLPSGNGSSYTANAAFGSGTSFGGGFVVYKGNGTIQNITSLVNGTIYYLTYYVRVGTVWSYIDVKTVTPNNSVNVYYVNDASTTSDIYCTAPGAAFNATTNDGRSSNKPVNKVQDIIDNYILTDEDIVLIDYGTYTESFSISSADMGSATGDVKFIGAGNTSTIFNASPTSNNVDLSSANYISIEQIRFNNNNSGMHNIYRNLGNYVDVKNCFLSITSTTTSTSSNIYLRAISGDGDYCELTGNVIENSAENGNGILIFGDNDNCTFDNNIITMTGTSGNGMYFDSYSFNSSNLWPTRNTISNNKINSNATALYLKGINESRNLVGYNIFNNSITVSGNTDESNSGIYLYAFGTMSGSDASTNIYNNRIIGGYAGIFIDNMTDGVNYYNNYICASKYGLFSFDDNGSSSSYPNKLYHNSFYNTQSCVYFNDGTSIYDTQKDFDIRNNIFYTTSSNTSHACMQFADCSGATDDKVLYTNYNIFYAPNGANIVRWHTFASYLTLSSWLATDMAQNGTNDPNSLNIDPKYKDCSVCNLDIEPADQKTGINVSVTSDIMGTNRLKPSIGAFESSINTLLPIELLYFNMHCKNDKKEIYWSTQSELNNDFFTVMASNDAKEWIELSKIVGAGTSNEIRNYDYSVSSNFYSYSYFKLKQTDFDGKFSYSKIIVADCSDTKNSFFYPNPANDEIIITLPTENEIHYQIIDQLGHVVVKGKNEANNNNISIERLDAGVYVLFVNDTCYGKLIKR